MACTESLFPSFSSAGKTDAVSSRTYPEFHSFQRKGGSLTLTNEHVISGNCVQVHPQQSPMPMFQEPASVMIFDRVVIERMSACTGWQLSDSISSSDGSSSPSPVPKLETAKGLKEHSGMAFDRLVENSDIEEIEDGVENEEYFPLVPYAYEPHIARTSSLSPPSALAIPLANKKQYKHTFHYPAITPIAECLSPVGVCSTPEKTTSSDPHKSYLAVARAKLSLSLNGNPITMGVQHELKFDAALDASRSLYKHAKSWVQARHCHRIRSDESQRMESGFDLILEE